jgi:YegS/Rv2252/BmrU family lipid kinase
MKGDRYCFIVNPAAGGGCAGRNWPALQQRLTAAGISHVYHISEHKGHSQELASAAFDAGHTDFVVVGGDGTANEVLNGVYPQALQNSADIRLGIIPWGTGNDWASYYGLPSAPGSLVDLLESGSSVTQDIGKASFLDSSGEHRTRYFLNCCGTGFDSYLLEEMNSPRGSRLRYFLYVLKCVYQYRAATLHLVMDEESVDAPVLLLEICIGTFAGAGMRFAPEAVADDGLFEVLLINELSIPQILASLFYLYNGRINEHSAVRRWQKCQICIAKQAEQFFHCDGELIAKLPVKIDILPRAIRVIAPLKNS